MPYILRGIFPAWQHFGLSSSAGPRPQPQGRPGLPASGVAGRGSIPALPGSRVRVAQLQGPGAGSMPSRPSHGAAHVWTHDSDKTRKSKGGARAVGREVRWDQLQQGQGLCREGWESGRGERESEG